ncbi:hypothetical protein [Paenibacillus thalictri]|uniref:Phosphodiester glycosidase domain-containing protein n=1 Tax=Paenibacillus thalictri TaxID=2527873 RepID=A0A4Q9DYP3_9BACL|nr:hypothetical protein [Paenibacillus thalictri]TBL80360.1 hypothetical protein EYB31_08060 [Paenibacillus thalictri]
MTVFPFRAASHTALNRKLYALLLLFAFLFGFGIAVKLHLHRAPEPPPVIPPPYQYSKMTASNGVVLHAIQTSPDNISLKAITTNVTQTGEFGINGGFFYNGDLLSIAVTGDVPAKGQQGDYGSGWYNTDRRKGTLVWDEVTRRFSVQIAESSDELQVADRNRYWAQGGVSMSLTREQLWRDQALAEDMPAFDEKRLRSAVVYDSGQHVWLIASETKATVEEFREAVKMNVARGTLVDGVFLDGDGSTQLKCEEAELKGDTRAVYQMMALTKTHS